jgi:hypothetical protein
MLQEYGSILTAHDKMEETRRDPWRQAKETAYCGSTYQETKNESCFI